MGRNRISKELRQSVTFQMEPALKAALEEEAERSGMTLSRMGAYAIQRWINAQEHVRHIEGMKKRLIQ